MKELGFWADVIGVLEGWNDLAVLFVWASFFIGGIIAGGVLSIIF